MSVALSSNNLNIMIMVTFDHAYNMITCIANMLMHRWPIVLLGRFIFNFV